MKVRDVMHQEVQWVRQGTPVTDVFELMRDGRFRHLPVLDSDDHVVGVVSDRDLRNVAVVYKESDADEENFVLDENTNVEEVMLSDPLYVEPNDELFAVVRLFREQHTGYVVVIENDRLVGVLSYLDLLEVLSDFLERSDATAV